MTQVADMVVDFSSKVHSCEPFTKCGTKAVDERALWQSDAVKHLDRST